MVKMPPPQELFSTKLDLNNLQGHFNQIFISSMQFVFELQCAERIPNIAEYHL